MRRPGRLGEVITLKRALLITNRSHEAENQESIWADRELAHLQSSAGAANILGNWGSCPPGTTWCPKHNKCHRPHAGLGAETPPTHRHFVENIATALIIGIVLLFVDHKLWP